MAQYIYIYVLSKNTTIGHKKKKNGNKLFTLWIFFYIELITKKIYI